MVLSYEEMQTSTDVFPITFFEMKRKYQVLAGTDVLANLPISDMYLRLRCEQELKNLLIRMQGNFLLQSHRSDFLLESLRRVYSNLLRCLRAAIQVLGESVPNDDERVVAIAADRFGLETDTLARVEEICMTDQAVGAEAIVQVYGQLLVEVHRAANAIDQLKHTDEIELDTAEN
ncbi:MAG: hypothetical protein ABGX16_01690 [Pirellulales bacterium]